LTSGSFVSTRKDKKKVIIEKITPVMMAVVMPENVPMNKNGTPKVNSTSQKTWVLATTRKENILHSMMM
jgi:hypothetical protein